MLLNSKFCVVKVKGIFRNDAEYYFRGLYPTILNTE